MLAVIAALCYGVTSVLSEYLMRAGSNSIAIVAHFGLFGFILSFASFFIFSEFSAFFLFSESPDSDYLSLIWYPCYAIGEASVYLFMLLTIRLSSATVLNLIGLTSSIWAMLCDVLIFNRGLVRFLSFRNWFLLLGSPWLSWEWLSSTIDTQESA